MGDLNGLRRMKGGAATGALPIKAAGFQLSICRPMNAAIPGTVNATIPCPGA